MRNKHDPATLLFSAIFMFMQASLRAIRLQLEEQVSFWFNKCVKSLQSFSESFS